MDLKGADIRNFYSITTLSGVKDSDAHRLIKIPHYQRPYKWTSEHIEKLVDDWWNENEKPRGVDQKFEYFAGAIVTVASNDEGAAHHLIDGQQRVTTLFLVNYIAFLVSRITIREAAIKSSVATCQRMLPKLEQFTKHLLPIPEGDQPPIFLNTVSNSGKLQNLINELEDCEENERADKAAEISGSLYLPPEKVGDDFSEEHASLLRDFFRDSESELPPQSLRLCYDRASYNEELLEALLSVVISPGTEQEPLCFSFIEGESDDELKSITQYQQALETIFDKFTDLTIKEVSKEKRPSTLKFMEKMVGLIESFLETISLCVVQTGNPNDAYTLFEVLNDRALALDDLDLVKNIIYKQYVEQTQIRERYSEQARSKEEMNKKIDSNIQRADTQWVDKIFRQQADAKRKLIAYLAIVYITGDIDVTYRDAAGYRNAMRSHFGRHPELEDTKFAQYFNIFEAAKIFIDVFEIKFRGQIDKALEAEKTTRYSTLYRTVHLLAALGQEGVLSGLFNFVMNYLCSSLNIDDFSPSKVASAFKDLIDFNEESIKLDNQAQEVWKTSIMAKDAAEPRKLSVSLIRIHNLQNANSLNIQYKPSEVGLNSLEGWLNSWQYGNKDEKVRILFARLLKLEVDPENPQQLISRAFNLNFNHFQLDHVEPVKIDPANPKLYFSEPLERNNLINGLGNMMPLSPRENKEKNNRPVSQSKAFFEQAGLGQHYLVKATYDVFYDKNHDDWGAPTAKFFHERKAYLVNLFKLAAEYKHSS